MLKFQGYQGSGAPPGGPMPPPSSAGNYYPGGPPSSKPSGPPNASLPPNGPPMPSRGPGYPGHYGGPPRPMFPPGKIRGLGETCDYYIWLKIDRVGGGSWGGGSGDQTPPTPPGRDQQGKPLSGLTTNSPLYKICFLLFSLNSLKMSEFPLIPNCFK